MINIFSELKKVNYQLSNALSTMFLRRLDIFLRFDTYVFENPQKAASCTLSYMRQEVKLVYRKQTKPRILRILEHICLKV